MKASTYAAFLGLNGIPVRELRERTAERDACIILTDDISISIKGRTFDINQWVEAQQQLSRYSYTDKWKAASLLATLPGLTAHFVVSEDVGGIEYQRTTLLSVSFARAVEDARAIYRRSGRSTMVQLLQCSYLLLLIRGGDEAKEEYPPLVAPVPQANRAARPGRRRQHVAKHLANGNRLYRGIEIVRDPSRSAEAGGQWHATTRGSLSRFDNVQEAKDHIDEMFGSKPRSPTR
ncbi:hypothetical protein RAS12_30195 (plasmid) [Achromobacter seleniivolatilans]|uniref:Uncharacterized protein n=1 Tax=Achromobacter seleniivolatilans TaxID=3047478 RepID=A0ABY9MAN0_9BURK|nr:hypothetical protein [Achromobacter sp. R39]WMD23905.1 hypothetical protein RAS12_30195 [Achromobacter sp. R39]